MDGYGLSGRVSKYGHHQRYQYLLREEALISFYMKQLQAQALSYKMNIDRQKSPLL